MSNNITLILKNIYVILLIQQTPHAYPKNFSISNIVI